MIDEKTILKKQFDGLSLDRGLIEKLSKGVSDESALFELESHQKTLENESFRIDADSEKNKEVRTEEIDEVDDYLGALESNLDKIEKIKLASDISVTQVDTGNLNRRIEELKDIKNLLDDEGISSRENKNIRDVYEGQISKYEGLKNQLDFENGDNLSQQDYIENVLKSLDSSLDKLLDNELVLASSNERKMNTPSIISSLGIMKGKWDGNTYFLDDDFVPRKYNKEKYSIREIKKNLKNRYGIVLDGIPFENGVADFSSVSIANIPADEIVARVLGMALEDFENKSRMDRAEAYRNVFSSASDGKSKRNKNFDIADQLAAEHEIDIPGLAKGYSATELKRWRMDNKFSWDEQVNGGYNLVPSVIHGNIAHTGLVSISSKAYDYINQYKEDFKKNPDKYSWDEEIAPITIQELYKLGGEP